MAFQGPSHTQVRPRPGYRGRGRLPVPVPEEKPSPRRGIRPSSRPPRRVITPREYTPPPEPIPPAPIQPAARVQQEYQPPPKYVTPPMTEYGAPPQKVHGPGGVRGEIIRIPHTHREYDYLKHIFPPEGEKITRKGYATRVNYGDYDIYNPDARYEEMEYGGVSYSPSFWEDPRHVAQAYITYKNMEPGEQAPEWLDFNTLEQAYKYLQYANGEEDWTNWKYLNKNDPGRQLLQSIPLPPLSEVMDREQYGWVMMNTLLEDRTQRTPENMSYLTNTQRAMLSAYDDAKDKEQFAMTHQPGWITGMQSVMDNPYVMTLAQVVPNVAIPAIASMVATGGAAAPLAIAYMGGGVLSGLGIAASNQIYEGNHYLADAIAGASAALPWGMAIGTAFGPGIGTAAGGGIAALLGAGAGLAYGYFNVGDYLANVQIPGLGIYGMPTLTGSRASDAAMALLDLPAETLERTLSMIIQAGGTVIDPEKYGTPGELLQNFGAAIKAGQLGHSSGLIFDLASKAAWPNYIARGAQLLAANVADSIGGTSGDRYAYLVRKYGNNPINGLPFLNELAIRAGIMEGNLEDIKYLGPGETFQYLSTMNIDGTYTQTLYPIPVALSAVQLAAVVEARREISRRPWDANKIIMDYQSTFGLPGNLSELIGHMILDPLNDWGNITKGIAGKVAQMAGQPNLASVMRMQDVSGIFEGLKKYPIVVQHTPMAQLTSFDLRYAGWDANTKGWKINQPRTSRNVLGKIFNFSRTPQSAVRDNFKNVHDYLGSILSGPMSRGDVVGIGNEIRKRSNAADTGVDKLADDTLTPMGLSMKKNNDSFLQKLNDMEAEYLGADKQRTLKDRLLASLYAPNETRTENKLLDSMANKTPDEMAADIRTRLETIVNDVKIDETRRQFAQDFLDEMVPKKEGDLPTITGENLKQVVDMFTGKDMIPRNLHEYTAKLIDSYMTHSTDLLIKALGVGPTHPALQVANALKAMQTAALLNINAGYLVVNAWQNPFTVLASGAGGAGFFMPKRVMEEFWLEMGMEPYRLHAGSGMAGAPELDIGGKIGIGEQEAMLRKVTQGKGILAEFERSMRKVQRSFALAPKASENVERAQGAAAMYVITKKSMDAMIRYGRKYTPIEKKLRQALAEYDPRLPDWIDQAIRDNYDIAQIKNVITEGDPHYSLSAAVDDVVDFMKIDPKIIQETLDAYPGIERRLKQVRTPDELRQVFKELYDNIELNHDKRLALEVASKMKDVMTRVGSSGTMEGFRVYDDIKTRIEAFYIRHTYMMIEAHAEADRLRDMGVTNLRQYWNVVRSKQNQYWNRMASMDYAALDGILNALDLGKPGIKKYTGDVIAQYKRWEKYYRLVTDEWNTYYKNYDSYKNKADRKKALNETYARLDEGYKSAIFDVHERQMIMDNDLIEMVRAKHGDGAAEAVKEWRQRLEDFTQRRGDLVQSIREKIRGMDDVAEVRNTWKKFNETEYLPLVRDFFKLDHEGLVKVKNLIEGMERPKAGGPETLAKTEARETPYEYQDRTAEKIIHSPNWGDNNYKSNLMDAGDILRELGLRTNGRADSGYIMEKVNRLLKHIEYMEKGYEKINEGANPEYIKGLKEAYEKQPTVSTSQDLALSIIKDLLNENINLAKSKLTYFKDNIDKIITENSESMRRWSGEISEAEMPEKVLEPEGKILRPRTIEESISDIASLSLHIDESMAEALTSLIKGNAKYLGITPEEYLERSSIAFTRGETPVEGTANILYKGLSREDVNAVALDHYLRRYARFDTDTNDYFDKVLKFINTNLKEGAVHLNDKTLLSVDISGICPYTRAGHGCLYCYNLVPQSLYDVKESMGKPQSPYNPTKATEFNAYNGEIRLMKERYPELIDFLNEMGGLRVFSYGDYQRVDIPTLSRIIADAEESGLRLKIITKQPEVVDLLGHTGNGIKNWENFPEDYKYLAKKDHPLIYYNLSTDFGIENIPELTKVAMATMKKELLAEKNAYAVYPGKRDKYYEIDLPEAERQKAEYLKAVEQWEANGKKGEKPQKPNLVKNWPTPPDEPYPLFAHVNDPEYEKIHAAEMEKYDAELEVYRKEYIKYFNEKLEWDKLQKKDRGPKPIEPERPIQPSEFRPDWWTKENVDMLNPDGSKRVIWWTEEEINRAVKMMGDVLTKPSMRKMVAYGWDMDTALDYQKKVNSYYDPENKQPNDPHVAIRYVAMNTGDYVKAVYDKRYNLVTMYHGMVDPKKFWWVWLEQDSHLARKPTPKDIAAANKYLESEEFKFYKARWEKEHPGEPIVYPEVVRKAEQPVFGEGSEYITKALASVFEAPKVKTLPEGKFGGLDEAKLKKLVGEGHTMKEFIDLALKKSCCIYGKCGVCTVCCAVKNGQGAIILDKYMSGESRAQIEFYSDGLALIRASKVTNVADLAHELGHMFRRTLLPTEMKLAAKWAGTDPWKWTVDADEKFASGFEVYLREGKAPTPELKNVFVKFREWLLKIYRTLIGEMDVELTPEIRRVYATLLGADPMQVKAYLDPFVNKIDASGNMPTKTVELPFVEGQERPIYGEEPKILSITETPEFKEWFGDSKVVDENGEPLRVYHGTIADFEKFDINKVKSSFLGKGFYFSDNPRYSGAYTQEAIYKGDNEYETIYREGAKIIPAYLYMEKPLRLGEYQRDLEWIVNNIPQYYRDGVIDTELLKKAGYDGIIWEGRTSEYLVFSNKQIKSAITAEVLGKPVEPEQLRPMDESELRTGDPTGEMPAGVLEDLTATQKLGEIGADAWYDTVMPMFKQLEDTMAKRGLSGGTKIPEALMPQVMKYIDNDITADFARAKAASVAYGTAMRDYALINYSDQRGIDNWMNVIFPYQFWATRSMLNWTMRFWDHPSWLANYYRLRKFMRSAQTRPGFPTRLRDTIQFPAPYLPDWAGDTLFFDPLQNVFPFDQFTNGMEYYTQQGSVNEKETMNILYQWKTQGQISQTQLAEAVQSKGGPLWDRAFAQAKADAASNKWDPFNFLKMFLGPALYLTMPYYLLTGQPEKLSVLPITRTGQAIQGVTQESGLEQLGKFVGGVLAGPENAYRKALGISEFGEYGDYYVDRQLANMVGDGTCTLKEALTAMIERSGPLYEEARNRIMLETASRIPGGMPAYAMIHSWKDPVEMGSAMLFNLYPSSILPVGELRARGLYGEYKNAGRLYAAGDKNAYNRFLEEHPEYEARLALFKEPEERLRQFMISEVWEKWETMGSAERQVFQDLVGESFNDYFLNDETRDYSLVDTETIAGWDKIMGGIIPRVPETEGVISDPDISNDLLNQAPPEEYAEVDTYRRLRRQMFPNYFALGERYFGMPEDQRKDFLKQFPELAEYWDWSRAYKEQHPVIEKYAWKPEEEQPEIAFDLSFMSDVTPVLARQLYSYYYADKALSEGALSDLQNIWNKSTNSHYDFEYFLDTIIRSAVAPGT